MTPLHVACSNGRVGTCSLTHPKDPSPPDLSATLVVRPQVLNIHSCPHVFPFSRRRRDRNKNHSALPLLPSHPRHTPVSIPGPPTPNHKFTAASPPHASTNSTMLVFRNAPGLHRYYLPLMVSRGKRSKSAGSDHRVYIK